MAQPPLEGCTQPTDSDVHVIKRDPHPESEMYPESQLRLCLAPCGRVRSTWQMNWHSSWVPLPVCLSWESRASSLLSSSLPLPQTPAVLAPTPTVGIFPENACLSIPEKLCVLLPPCGHVLISLFSPSLSSTVIPVQFPEKALQNISPLYVLCASPPFSSFEKAPSPYSQMIGV